MHELGIITNLFTLIEEISIEHHLSKINRVKLKLGQMQQIVPESLTFAFEVVATGTKADGAKLEIEQVPVKMQCAACAAEFLIAEHTYICPACSGTRLNLLEGIEIVLESVEGDPEE
jgi:hydrogenase nickel incorporation protein HypA/HybF